MQLIKIVNARHALQKLIAQDLPLRVAYRLMKLTDSCNFHLDFYGNERLKLGTDPDPDRLAALNEMEVTDMKETKLRIPITDDLKLSAADIKALEPFIVFFEEE